MSTVLMDQLEEVVDEYQSDEQIEGKIIEDIIMACRMELYQRQSEIVGSVEYGDTGGFDEDE